jgi:hypothetical protein
MGPLPAIFFAIGDLLQNGLFFKVPSRLVSGHDHRLGRRRRNRRAIVGEGTHARQVLVGGTSHRGTSQDEGEGEDEADGAHLTVSGCVAGSARRLVGHLITVGCFRTSAPKTENGFIAQEKCFVGFVGRNIGRKNSMNSAQTPSLQMIRLNTESRPLRALWNLSHRRGRLVHWLIG